jgi:hypothetical protein
MACACSKKKASPSFVVELPDGTTKTYRSETVAKKIVAAKGGSYKPA